VAKIIDVLGALLLNILSHIKFADNMSYIPRAVLLYGNKLELKSNSSGISP